MSLTFGDQGLAKRISSLLRGEWKFAGIERELKSSGSADQRVIILPFEENQQKSQNKAE